MGQVTVRLYQAGDEVDFRRLNERWIAKYFRLEEKDSITLSDPQTHILDEGGQVFMAILDGVAVGCVALAKMDEHSYELIKMAVDESYQRRGIGRAVMNAAIEWARKQGARRLWLETNHALAPALKLYETSGFKYIPKEKHEPSPYQRSDVQMEMWLEPEWAKYL